MLDHPFGLSARGSKQKKLIVSLIEYISEVRALMDINVIFGWSKISNDTAPMGARRFWTSSANWTGNNIQPIRQFGC
jgi:hypothetical protein